MAEKKGNNFVCKAVFDLCLTWVKPFPDPDKYQHAFQLIGVGKTFVLLPKSPEESISWQETICAGIEKHSHLSDAKLGMNLACSLD